MNSWLDQGWCRIEEFISADELAAIVACCDELLALPEQSRLVGDKPHAGTRHLVKLDERCAVVADIVTRSRLLDVVEALIGPDRETLQVSYRSPQPGFGSQKLHVDGLAKRVAGPEMLATAIVPLVDFTAVNGSTRVVPRSHRRPDVQRLAGGLDRHREEERLLGAAGCAFVFSGHLLHSGTQNTGAVERPALQLQWQRS